MDDNKVASVEACEWKESESGEWDTSCENTFVFDEGDPEENGQKFCCYCGKPLKAIPFVYPSGDEEKARNKLVDTIFQLIHTQLDVDDVESQMGGEIFDAAIEKFIAAIRLSEEA